MQGNNNEKFSSFILETKTCENIEKERGKCLNLNIKIDLDEASLQRNNKSQTVSQSPNISQTPGKLFDSDDKSYVSKNSPLSIMQSRTYKSILEIKHDHDGSIII